MPAALSPEIRQALEELEFRLIVLLPEQYQENYDEVQPVSMGSAGLKFAPDGRVAWDEIWQTFCDLAMAGGPPHRGTILLPARPAEIDAQPERYAEVVAELCRAVSLVTGLPTEPSPTPGWVRATCPTDVMSAWLLRAIVMENISVRREGRTLHLPAGPTFRLEKEIKNVVTTMAKTCHYWTGHMPDAQRGAVEDLLARLEIEEPCVVPATSERDAAYDALVARIAEDVCPPTGLVRSVHVYAGWLGLVCPSVRAAVWMMRAMVAGNVLARREATTLFVAVNPATDPDGARVISTLRRVHRLAGAAGAH